MTVVTVSRQYASDGDEIAALVCEMLGYRYFDKRAVAEVVAEGGLTVDDMLDYSEDDYKLRTFLDRILGWRVLAPRPPVAAVSVSTEPVAAVVLPGQALAAPARPRERGTGAGSPPGSELNENMLIWLMHAAIQAVYKQGNAVIVGRGGQAILRDQPGVLHVRIEAPIEARIRNLEEREHFGHAEARELVQKHDRQAAEYLKRFYGVDWSDPTLYHIVVNTAYWDIEGAAKIVAAAAGCLPVAEPAE